MAPARLLGNRAVEAPPGLVARSAGALRYAPGALRLSLQTVSKRCAGVDKASPRAQRCLVADTQRGAARLLWEATPRSPTSCQTAQTKAFRVFEP